ncbi:hypothetical protein SAMN06265379_102203 [Saccharicrinis carchari]|uniref:Uncharacterized protein n=1 Tax=Saccharicrinis carchari TaxID=1168039 RepID=A0A521BYB0_SACCC|nr:hypothetical protein SAMN06265379_102203 [Saccharicrinis carchari]
MYLQYYNIHLQLILLVLQRKIIHLHNDINYRCYKHLIICLSNLYLTGLINSLNLFRKAKRDLIGSMN